MMKKILVLVLCCASCGSVAAQKAYTLEQLLDSALHHNVAVRNARLGVEAAEQQRKEAFTKYFPNVSGTGLWFNANKGMAKTDVNAADRKSVV